MTGPIFARDWSDARYTPPDHRRHYRAGYARGLCIGLLIGVSIGLAITIIAAWR